jgi:GR25 family glycosyltransferase involved in LPS biosynthesis
MNLGDAFGAIRGPVFRARRRLVTALPGRRIHAFGEDAGQISRIVVINLDRQPLRWKRVWRELSRFRTAEGSPLTTVVCRFAAIDARDNLGVASTADVDPSYQIGDQLYVQPDERLARSFPPDEPVHMTRQEVAVARSHIEVWKMIRDGSAEHVLVLEDDVWFRSGAAAALDRGWRAASSRWTGPVDGRLLYVSYSDAGGTVTRADSGKQVFRPVRGLWFLSGYVISREAAALLLHRMPVVGPVDLWMNYRLPELSALALRRPAIEQSRDGASENAYSILPYLARAGVVDSVRVRDFRSERRGPTVFAWTNGDEHEALAMALSMLGLRVRVYDEGDAPMSTAQLGEVLKLFDAVVNAPLESYADMTGVAGEGCVHVAEVGSRVPAAFGPQPSVPSKSITLQQMVTWDQLCGVLSRDKPVEAPPVGAHRDSRLFRGSPRMARSVTAEAERETPLHDDSPWVLPASARWRPSRDGQVSLTPSSEVVMEFPMTEPTPGLEALIETFPGNRAMFTREGLNYGPSGATLELGLDPKGSRPFRSGALATARPVHYGRVESEFRAAEGPGLVTGFFLHRGRPRQEIDIEILGSDPCRMLTNVYFNPGDDGTTMDYGYRGTPCWVDLGFNATRDFHRYAIDWRPDRVAWIVDDEIVHVREGWDPTPIPHLPMRLHANLWSPRSKNLAGAVDTTRLPARARFRVLRVTR